MNGFYRRQYNGSEIRQRPQNNNENEGMLMIDPQQGGMSTAGMTGSQSLDEIVSQNSKEIHGGGVSVPFSDGQPLDTDLRRMAMMDFNGTSPVSPLDLFQYDTSANTPVDNMMRPVGNLTRHNSGSHINRQAVPGHIALNTQLQDPNAQAFGGIGPSSSTFASPLAINSGIDSDMTSPYMASTMPVTMDLSDSAMNVMMNADPATASYFSHPHFSPPVAAPQLRQNFANQSKSNNMDMTNSNVNQKDAFIQNDSPQSTNAAQEALMPPQEAAAPRSSQPMNTSNQAPQNQMTNMQLKQDSLPADKSIQTQLPNSMSDIKFNWTTPPGGFPSTMNNKPHTQSQFKNAYSSTGFDMLGVLMRVATRPNPEINVGSVDLSCAFVVCDAEKEDNPIVYCSDNFERLTGYNRHMILGRNCRFLQSPNGKVEAGKKRKYVDDDSVYYLKNMVTTRREAQMSLINYRKGGQPFMNLLTVIPITWDSDHVKYIVGFQVDLVEQPNSVLNKNPDGSYAINYQRSLSMPKYIFHGADNSGQLDLGQTIPRDDVSTVLSNFSSGESELSKRIWDKLLLENSDDVIHVLSLKGLFLYLSPSSRKVLEYDSHELVGRSLSSVCHPSDIVPVTRELKETTSGSSVNVVFRIRRKESGYMWFEGHGSLHTEQGKGRKCIILVGRERPVYAIAKYDILASGGIGENELWSKISTSGMMLYVSSNVRQLLDRQPDELVGTSMQALMQQDSRAELGRVFQLVRSGRKASVKHDMINKRGQVLQAFTTLYPGDAVEGQKPTFIIAQTRMLKHSRAGPKGSSQLKQDRDSNSINSGNSMANGALKRSTTGESASISQNQFTSTDGFAMTYSGHDGLAIGHQDNSLASEANLFDELKTTRSTSWQYELRQMEKRNRLLAEEVQNLLAAKKKRKRRKGAGQLQKDCANCHTSITPEWRRGPSGNRDLCNSCGLRWAKQNGRVSPRTPSQHSVQSAQSSIASTSPRGPRNIPSQLNNFENSAQAPMSATNDTKGATQGLPNAQIPDVQLMGMNSSQGMANNVPPKIDEVAEPS